MNLEQLLRSAQWLRRQARVMTSHGDYERAREILKRLITEIGKYLTSPNKAELQIGSSEGRSQHELARVLVDSYGMLGGVEWRAGNLQDALDAYQSGQKVEDNPRYRIEGSYNRTNAIVLLILVNPDAFDRLRPQVEKAAETVRLQIEGERRDQWWAWADYGLLSLLLGRRDEAERAYLKFDQCGPGPSDFNSVTRVMGALAEAVAPISIDTAESINRNVTLLEELKEA